MLKQVLRPPNDMKVKSEVSVRTYQTHTGTHTLQESQLHPTTPRATQDTKPVYKSEENTKH